MSSECGSVGSDQFLAKRLAKRASTVGKSVTVKVESPCRSSQQPPVYQYKNKFIVKILSTICDMFLHWQYLYDA